MEAGEEQCRKDVLTSLLLRFVIRLEIKLLPEISNHTCFFKEILLAIL